MIPTSNFILLLEYVYSSVHCTVCKHDSITTGLRKYLPRLSHGPAYIAMKLGVF
jgi:hypothetical protein